MRHAAPVFLIGAPRSGTTLVFKALCAHPEAAWFSNWYEKVPRLWPVSALNRIAPHLPATRRRVWFGADGSRAYSYGTTRGMLDRLLPMPVEGESIFRTCGIVELGAPGHAAPRAEQIDRLRRTLGRLRTTSGRPVVVNKRIENNRRIPLLIEAFPDARFIEIVRDGRAVAASMRRVDWWDRLYLPFYGATVSDWRDEGRDEWEAAGRQWVQELEDIDAGRPFVPPDQWQRVRYEDLIDDAIPMFERLAEHAGLRPSAEWRATVHGLVFPDRTELWRSSVDDAAQAVLEEIQGQRLVADGYQL